jgi:hypothetical protein
MPKLTKRCTRCGGDKPLEEFRKQEGKLMGVRYQCKACQDEIEAARYKLNVLKDKFPDYEKYKVIFQREHIGAGKFRLLGDCPLCGADLLIDCSPHLDIKQQCVECTHVVIV